MRNTTQSHPIRALVVVAGVAALMLALAAPSPSAGETAGKNRKTETLRFFDKPVAFTYTAVDGTVTPHPPARPPQAGDVFEIDSLAFSGDHRRHAKRPISSTYLRCAFVEGGEPDCYAWVAIRGALLRFRGNEIIGGGGRYLGATGRAVKNEEVPGGSDVVVKLRRR
jgi:hypothetical protein